MSFGGKVVCGKLDYAAFTP
ncbi:hypothetical protein M2H09_22585 [Vibrio vulnificus]|nr:hypothetical protein [Vibrio vulnificus]